MWTKRKNDKSLDTWYHGVWLSRRMAQALGSCEVSYDGWVLYSLDARNHGGYWEGSFYLILMDEQTVIERYELSVDEFWSFPNMPQYWYTPF